MGRKSILCPTCRVPYRKVRTNFESRGVIVKDVEAYCCKICGTEIFSIPQVRAIRKKIEALSPSVSLERKISSAAGKKPVIYLPEPLLAVLNLRVGDMVNLAVEGKRLVISRS